MALFFTFRVANLVAHYLFDYPKYSSEEPHVKFSGNNIAMHLPEDFIQRKIILPANKSTNGERKELVLPDQRGLLYLLFFLFVKNYSLFYNNFVVFDQMIRKSVTDKMQNNRRCEKRKQKELDKRLGDVYNTYNQGTTNANVFINNCKGSNSVNHINCASAPEIAVPVCAVEKKNINGGSSFHPYATFRSSKEV